MKKLEKLFSSKFKSFENNTFDTSKIFGGQERKTTGTSSVCSIATCEENCQDFDRDIYDDGGNLVSTERLDTVIDC